MFAFDRPVQFQDVDAAGIVFFARFFVYAHDAMVALVDHELSDGYAGLINDRRLGLPVVHVEADFKVPLRFGDVASIEVTVMRIGQKSSTLRFTMKKQGVVCAVITNTVVLTDFGPLKGIEFPEDIRGILQKHAS